MCVYPYPTWKRSVFKHPPSFADLVISCPQSTTLTSAYGLLAESVFSPSIFFTTSKPEMTRPKTTWTLRKGRNYCYQKLGFDYNIISGSLKALMVQFSLITSYESQSIYVYFTFILLLTFHYSELFPDWQGYLANKCNAYPCTNQDPTTFKKVDCFLTNIVSVTRNNLRRRKMWTNMRHVQIYYISFPCTCTL